MNDTVRSANGDIHFFRDHRQFDLPCLLPRLTTPAGKRDNAVATFRLKESA